MPGEGAGERSLSGNIRNLVLDLLNLRYLLDFQVKISRRQLYVPVWSSEERFRLIIESLKKVSMDREENQLWTLRH